MIKRFSIALLFFTLVFVYSCNAREEQKQEPSQPVKLADAEILKMLLSQDGTKIVDVRRDNEYNSGHVEGSLHIPLNDIVDSISTLATYSNLIVVCQSGGRSNKAKVQLEENGFTNVYNGGGWERMKAIVEENEKEE